MPDNAISPNEPSRRGSTRKPSTSVAKGEPPLPHVESRSDDATLRLIRKTWGGILTPFNVELDGFHVNELAYGQTLDLKITPGEHILFMSGGGAFLGSKERFLAEENEILVYTVCYSWYGGIKLSRVL